MRHMGEFCPGPEALAGWLEQSLSAAERARVTAHLAACDECRRAVTIASTVQPPPQGEVDELLLQRVVSAARRRPLAAWVAVAAAALLAAGIFFWVARPNPTPDPSPAPGIVVTPPAPRPPLTRTETPPNPPLPVPPAPETPLVVPTPEPLAPKPEVKPEPPREEPKKPVLVREEPKPESPREEPVPPVVKTPPGLTKTDLSTVFAPVFVIDPSGDLWLNRPGSDPARVGRYEQVGYTDTLSARDAAGAFALEGKATMALEKGASAAVSWKRSDNAYALTLTQGTVMVDTEGAEQKWQVSRGIQEVTFANLNGRFVVEQSGEKLAAVMLAGRADVKVGSLTRRLESGREMVLSGDGKPAERAAQPKKYARLAQLRPRDVTVFAATFDESKDEPIPFPYTIAHGKLAKEGYLRAGIPEDAYPKAGEKVVAWCSVKPERPIVATAVMQVVFRYRTSFPAFTLKLGKYSTVFYPARLKAGEWGEGRLSLDAFEFEGTPPDSGEALGEIQFQAVLDGKKPGFLEVDGVHFFRRAR